MLQFGAIVRFLMLVVCLVPFTSVQQAAGALAPYFPSAPTPVREAPAPVSEEDDERATDGKGRHPHSPRPRIPPVREQIDRLPPAYASHQTHLTRPLTTPPVTEDSFRNGLGTPYRC